LAGESPPLPADFTTDPEDIDIVPGFNPRSYLNEDAFMPEALQSLKESIEVYGILQPVVVRREHGRLKLIAGERRLRSARLLGLKNIPVIVRDVDESEALRLAIIENAQREDVDIISETLLGFDLLSKHTGLSQTDVIAYLNVVRKGRQSDVHNVEGLLRSTYGTGISLWSQRRALVLKMTEAEWTAIRTKQLDVAVCAELVPLPQGELRTQLLNEAIENSLSASQVKARVRDARKLSVSQAPLKARITSLRSSLSKIAKLKGHKATEAEELISRLEGLLQD